MNRSLIFPMITLSFGLMCILTSVALLLNIKRNTPASYNDNVKFWCGQLVEVDGKSVSEVRQAIENFQPVSKRDGLSLKMCKLYLDF